MMEIPTFSQYDSKKAKARCSIQWVIKQSGFNHFSRADLEHVFECDGGLKQTIAALLCSGNPYCKIAEFIFGTKERLCSHEDVIQILCRKGLYVLDDADSLITAHDLRKMPLDLSSHLTIIDMIMYAFITHKLTSINTIVSTVRKFSDFSASRELPDNLEEAFMLWLNKVSNRVQIHRRDTIDSDKHTFGQPREENFEFPIIRNLTEDLFDGRSISLLLHYYCPNHVFQDICIKDPISIADSWHNLTQSLNFCNSVLLPPSTHNAVSSSILHPVDFLYSGQDMKMNILVFLATLFHYLEDDALQDVVSPIGHTVICKRLGETTTYSENDSSSMPENRTLSLASNDDRRQQALMQANNLIPGVQPLISNATKKSFSKTNSTDTDSMSTIRMDEQDDYSSPVPFSSKPLLVRRNRDIHAPLPSSASRSSYKSTSDNLPMLKSKDVSDNDYATNNGTFTSGSSYPSSISSTYQGLSNGELNTGPTVVNKWHFRTPVQDLQNSNTSNNILIAGYHTPISHHLPSKQRASSGLLSNVEMDNENDMKMEPGRSRILGLGDSEPLSGDKLSWSTFEFRKTFESPKAEKDNSNVNDLVLETARTSDYYNSARSVNDSDNFSDLTSVSSRTASSAGFSNEGVPKEEPVENRTYFVQTKRQNYPDVINTDVSPEIPRNITYVKPKANPDTSSSFTPFSQKSYTVQNDNFRTVDSARAAGYPVIETSPVRSQRSRSGEIKPAETNGEPIQNHMVIGGTVVKLRNSQRRSVNRSTRSNKVASWFDQSKKQQIVGQNNEGRRHSNIPHTDKNALIFKNFEENRRFIEERRRMEDRRKFIEKERKEKKWLDEIFREFGLEATKSKPGKEQSMNQKQIRQTPLAQPNVSQHVATFHKNEETSSDYSSKSPSPSSIHNHNNIEPNGNEHKILQKFISQHHNPNESPQSQNPNFFASPLSTTAYLVQKPGQSSLEDQSFNHYPAPPVGHRDQTLDQNTSHNGYESQTERLSNASQLHNGVASGNFQQHQVPTVNNTYDVCSNAADQTTYDVIEHLPESTSNPEVLRPNLQVTREDIHQSQLPQRHIPPEINILQALPSEHSTRRSLFPGGGNQDPDTSAEQENIDPNHLGVGNADQTSYDSFSCKITVGSNHSTPHKMSPINEKEMITPSKENNDEDMSSTFQKTADKNRKGGEGFELVDDTTPNTDVAKKKEQFLLKQLKKEEELKKKRADRENETEKRKEEARLKQEEVDAKKAEEKQKRQQRLDEYKKRKLQQEEAQLVQQSSTIVGGSGKKHPKPESTPHCTRLDKISGSGRCSPATECSNVHNNVQGITFIANADVEQASAKLFRTRRMSGGRKDWDNESASSSAVSSDYTGPKLYKQPSSKSNRHIIYNAICHCCLPGKVNEVLRNNTIQVLEMSDARHFLILFRDAKCQFRALYTYDPDGASLRRLSGNGPKDVIPSMIERLFKYNSGRKAFTPLPSKTLSVSIDAITIKNTFWQSNKKTVAAKK